MFYDVFKMLCEKKGVSCNRAAMDIGLSNSTPTKWKKTGASPDSTTLSKVSSYFGVTPDYLLGFTNDSGIITRYKISDWISVKDRPPEELEPVNVVWVNHRPEPYYWEIKDVPQKATAVYYRKKWYWWSCVCKDFLAEYGRNEPDLVDSGIEITHWMPLPELPDAEAALAQIGGEG